MGGRSLVAGLSATARAFIFAVSVVGAACAEDGPAGPQPADAAPARPSAVERAPAGETDKSTATAAVQPSDTDQKPADTAATPTGEGEPQPGDGAAPPDEAGQDPAGASPPSDGAQEPSDTATPAPGDSDQKPDAATTPPSDTAAPPVVAEQAPADPIVAAIRAKLAEPGLRKNAASEDLAALEHFYAERSGPPLWITGMGFSARAQAVISEIQNADDWGLASDAFDLPAASDLPATMEAQATDEIKLGLAILKYARYARGGRISPARISVLFDQKPAVRAPKTVLTEIAASATPDAYLRSLHPQQQQFERLRQALVKARGRKPANEGGIQRLIINMERWRWMPAELGSTYVWDNIPEFIGRVVKNGKTIYTTKVVVGLPKYATPIFSADMRSIVFNPEWVVPETIKLEDLQPALRGNGFLGAPDTSILRDHELTVSYQGKPVDAEQVDWSHANILQYTFTQPPGPDNVLGTLKFNFPNKHAIYMHDTIQPEFFDETVRMASHGCIRVYEPARLAALLLAEDKGWSAQQVTDMLAKGNNSVVSLSRKVPVHVTYFTATVDEKGKIQSFDDIYGLDSKMASALFGKATKFDAPTTEAAASGGRKRSAWNSGKGGLTDAITGLFGN
jgi:murein L,D-transpeptidase YcbB/YkuD